MSNFIKKAFTVGVVVTTIFWSLGLAAFPLTANAATIAAGDLITAPGTKAVYYYDGSSRWVFPNEKTYYTWYSDFSTVKEITDAELGDIAIGGNVVYQAGRMLVKITTDPKVYFVGEDGTLHHVTTETVASGMFGPNWAKMVQDVPDAFFTNYSIGDEVSDPETYLPVGAYFVYGGNLYYVDDADVLKLTFARSELVVDPNPVGEEYVAAWQSSLDLSGWASGATTVSTYDAFASYILTPSGTAGEVPTGALTMQFNMPTDQTILTNQGATWIGQVEIQNNTGSAQTLESFTASVGGALPYNGLANLFGVTSSDSVYEPYNNPVNFGSSDRTRTVYGNKSLPTGTSYLDIFVGGGAAGGGTTGTFNLLNVVVGGETYTFDGATVGVNRSVTSASSMTVANGATPATANIGGTNQNISNFTVNFGKAGTISGLWIYESGTGDINKLSNCKLVVQSLEYTGQIVGNYILFIMNSPFAGTEGSTYSFALYCDIAEGENAANSYVTSLRNTGLIMTLDGYYSSPFNVTNTFTGVTAVLQQGEILTSSVTNTPVDIQAGTTDQLGAKFVFDKAGTYLNTFVVELHRTGTDIDTADAEALANDIRNIRVLLVRNGAVIATLDSVDIINMANKAGVNTGLVYTISANIAIQQGDQIWVKFNSQNSTNLNNNTYYYALTFSNASFTDEQGNALTNYVPTMVSGNYLRFTTAGLTISLGGGVAAATHSFVSGNQRIAALEIAVDPGTSTSLKLNSVSINLMFDDNQNGTYGQCTDPDTSVSCTVTVSTIWGEDSSTGEIVLSEKSAAGTITWSGLNMSVEQLMKITFYVKTLIGGPASSNADWLYVRVTGGTAQDTNGSPVNVTANPSFNLNNTGSVKLNLSDSGTVQWRLSSSSPSQSLRKMGSTYTDLIMQAKTTNEIGAFKKMQLNLTAGTADEYTKATLICPQNSNEIEGIIEPVGETVAWTNLSSDPANPKYCPIPTTDEWWDFTFKFTYNTWVNGADVSTTGAGVQKMLQNATNLEFIFDSGASVTTMTGGVLTSARQNVVRGIIVISQQTLPSTVLSTGNNTVSKLLVTADPVQIYSVVWTLTGTLAGSTIGDDDAGCAGGGANGICTYLNTYRGSSCVVIDSAGTTIPATITYANNINGAYVRAVFTAIETVSTTKVYQLRCSFTGVQTNDSVSTKLADNNFGYELTAAAGVTANSSLVWTGDPDAVAVTVAWHNDDYTTGTEITQTLFK